MTPRPSERFASIVRTIVSFPAAERGKYDGIAGDFSDGSSRFEVNALIDRSQPNKIILRLRRTAPVADARIWEVEGYHFNHSDGLVAGRGVNDACKWLPPVRQGYGRRDPGVAGDVRWKLQRAPWKYTGVLATSCNGRADCEYTVDYKVSAIPRVAAQRILLLSGDAREVP